MYEVIIHTKKIDYLVDVWRCTITLGLEQVSCVGNSEYKAVRAASKFLCSILPPNVRPSYKNPEPEPKPDGLSGHLPGSASGAAVDDLSDVALQSAAENGVGVRN